MAATAKVETLRAFLLLNTFFIVFFISLSLFIKRVGLIDDPFIIKYSCLIVKEI